MNNTDLRTPDTKASALVSIIVPVYNAETYLDPCIESVLCQTYPHFQLLLVNDGSTDRSPEICDSYAARDPRVRVIHTQNQGPSAARNRGIAEASGAYIAFLDSDDLLDREMLDKTVTAIIRHQADLVITGYERFWPAWKNSFQLARDNELVFHSLKELATVYTKADTNMFGISIWAKLYRTDILRQQEIRFRKDISYEEDCLFNLDYFRHITTTAVLPDCLYQYRQMEVSLSKGYRRNTFPFLVNGYQARKALLKELDLPTEGARRIFALVVENTLTKICNSSLSLSEKQDEYRAILAFPETRDACSHSTLSGGLSRAVVRNNPAAVHRILSLRRMKNRIFSAVYHILRTIKRSIFR